jgi:hypothetical protein
MTTGELIDWLRYRAIDFGMPPQFIDAVDELVLSETAQEDIDSLKEELEEAEYRRDQARTILRQLIAASDQDADLDDAVEAARSYFEL